MKESQVENIMEVPKKSKKKTIVIVVTLVVIAIIIISAVIGITLGSKYLNSQVSKRLMSW